MNSRVALPRVLQAEALSKARALFSHTSQGRIYLNHAGTSPLSTKVLAVMTKYLQERNEGTLETYQRDLPMVGECRDYVRQLIHAESSERIAITPNTSDAINIIASGIPWKSGDRILLNTAEFSANVWPYIHLKNAGVQTDFIQCPDGRITIDRILDRLTPRTRLLALSAVQFLSGFRADMETIGEICRSRGIIFAVDAIQAVGAVRINVQKMSIDALAAGGQKWQMAPHGSGFLYLTEELQSIIRQKSIGWLGVEDPWDFSNYDQPLAQSARRYEGGTLVMPSLWGLHTSLGTLLEFGIEAIEGHILALSQFLIDGFSRIDGVQVVTPSDPEERAGIVTIGLPGSVDAKVVFKELQTRNIQAALREGKLRFSPHFYCSVEEMRKTVETTADLLHGRI